MSLKSWKTLLSRCILTESDQAGLPRKLPIHHDYTRRTRADLATYTHVYIYIYIGISVCMYLFIATKYTKPLGCYILLSAGEAV